jgi:hypothetical protein
MKRKILQYLADYLIIKLEQSIGNEKLFDYYLNVALRLDSYAVVFLGIDLD